MLKVKGSLWKMLKLVMKSVPWAQFWDLPIHFVPHTLIKQICTLFTFILNDSIRADCVWEKHFWWILMNLRFCYTLFRCSSNKSRTMLLACGYPVNGPRRIKADFPFAQSLLCGSSSLQCRAGVLSLSLIPSLLLFDAGHVSVAPQLIYHSNCEWRTGTAKEQRKAAPTLPALTIYLVICAKAVPSMENGDLVFWGSRWAKTTQHTPLRISSKITRKPMRIFWCMLVND